jgi:hypothetical protein
MSNRDDMLAEILAVGEKQAALTASYLEQMKRQADALERIAEAGEMRFLCALSSCGMLTDEMSVQFFARRDRICKGALG